MLLRNMIKSYNDAFKLSANIGHISYHFNDTTSTPWVGLRWYNSTKEYYYELQFFATSNSRKVVFEKVVVSGTVITILWALSWYDAIDIQKYKLSIAVHTDGFHFDFYDKSATTPTIVAYFMIVISYNTPTLYFNYNGTTYSIT